MDLASGQETKDLFGGIKRQFRRDFQKMLGFGLVHGFVGANLAFVLE